MNQKTVLPLIVLSQFAGTSIWFVGNAILPELKQSLHLPEQGSGLISSAVNIGFVAGTLFSAFAALADRFSPVRLFLASAILGALSNLAIIWFVTDIQRLFWFRFSTGFFLAGIYPIGMKIAADWYKEGLGKALGWLVGALVIGTAFPYLLRDRKFDLPWQTALYITSAMALLAGILMTWLGDGPHRKAAGKFQWNAIPAIFSSPSWRKAAFGYFGHMWELYTFWGFLPLIIALYASKHQLVLNIPLLSFLVIASGGISCVLGGYLSSRLGSNVVARTALYISGLCCLFSVLMFNVSLPFFLAYIFIWGFTVCADSPQFSSLVSQYSIAEQRGTAFTIYNAIGFTISSLSLYLMDTLYHSSSNFSGERSFMLLGLGMLLGNFPYRFKRPGR
ncbi:MAG: MFS transporter [Chitinophagaceae bacterium]|nr:MFS transporter [Chitinophagaceae bacterium]